MRKLGGELMIFGFRFQNKKMKKVEYCGAWILASAFFMSFAYKFCWGELLQGRTAEKNLGLSTGLSSNGDDDWIGELG